MIVKTGSKMLEAAQNISAVIYAYTEERWHELIAAVESIQRQSIPSDEIIVVIDHNTKLFERVTAHVPGIAVIESSEPKGLSGARNTGIAQSQGVLIAFKDMRQEYYS
jgi:glycosyltransferase involved in cell wall biosynthesis